jgi:branched-subunit amino acid transport protein
MTAPASLVLAAVVLGAGTFAFRFAGPVLRTRFELPPRVERLLAVAAVVLLAALVGTASLLDGHHFAGFARATGVAVGGVLAWRKAPFVVVVGGAAATAAALRLLGIA